MMYQVLNTWDGRFTGVKRLSDGASVPPDLDNTDYQQYLAWLAQGNEPLPPDNQV